MMLSCGTRGTLSGLAPMGPFLATSAATALSYSDGVLRGAAPWAPEVVAPTGCVGIAPVLGRSVSPTWATSTLTGSLEVVVAGAAPVVATPVVAAPRLAT